MALCEKCKSNQGTIQIVQIVNGHKSQRILCHKCAQEENVFAHTGNNNSVHSPAWVSQAAHDPQEASHSDRSCSCGFTYQEFMETGYLGCPKCYETFKELLQPTIRKVQHGNEIHRGMRPLGGIQMPNSQEITDPVELLRKRLEEAVLREEYELAAQLRDEIRALTKEGSHA